MADLNTIAACVAAAAALLCTVRVIWLEVSRKRSVSLTFDHRGPYLTTPDHLSDRDIEVIRAALKAGGSAKV